MVDKAQAAASGATDDAATPGTPVKRSMHRHTDARDAVAEMAARAQEISQEAGSRIGKAMKDIIGAAAGLAGFAVESARDLAQYMVRRGQMTQEEADKLIREAEEAYKKGRHAPSKGSGDAAERTSRAANKPAAKSAAPKKAAAKKKSAATPKTKTAAAKKPAAKSKTGKSAASKKKPAATAARAKSKPAKKKK
jgi:histone H1/5